MDCTDYTDFLFLSVKFVQSTVNFFQQHSKARPFEIKHKPGFLSRWFGPLFELETNWQ
jgi:hypothetical protein